MAGEELILRFFAFYNLGLNSYYTPMKLWLNEQADRGRRYDDLKIDILEAAFENMISIVSIWFSPEEAFRKEGSKAINKGLFDLVCYSASRTSKEIAFKKRGQFREAYYELLRDSVYLDIVSRSVDHKKRTLDRFKVWSAKMDPILID